MRNLKEVYKKNKEIINYLIIGGLTTLVGLLGYYLLVFTVLDPNNYFELQVANVISWIMAVTFAYITNRKFVFESKRKEVLKEGLAFYSSRIITLLIDMGFMFLFVSLLGFNDKIIKAIIQIIVIIANYIISKFIVFKDKG